MSDQQPPADPACAPYKKSGIILFGDIGAKRYVVAPYTEGRFGAGAKYYVLAKGSIDPGEDALAGAIRETSEETGIDVKKLLGKEAIEALRRGEEVRDIASGYPGVRIKRLMPNAMDFTYVAREDNKNHTVLFGIELEGIEHLYDHLKNPQNRSKLGISDQVKYTVRGLTDNEQYPTFDECLQWLREMKMPQAAWSGEKAGRPLEPVNGNDAHWFAKLEADFMKKEGLPGRQIQTIPQWQTFQQQLSPHDYLGIRLYAEQVKKQLGEIGVLKGGDEAIIKFDTKDCPLVFYQEGADILSTEEYLKNCLDSGLNRRDYARAFCGNTPGMVARNAPRMERIASSQLAGVVWANSEQDIARVADHFRDNPAKTRKDNSWLGGDMYDDSLRTDLLGVHAQTRKWEVPLSKILKADAKHEGLAVPLPQPAIDHPPIYVN